MKGTRLIYYSDKRKRLCRRIAIFVSLLLISPFAAKAQDSTATDTSLPVHLDGSISISANKYSVSGAPARRPPTGWTIVGTPSLSFGGFSLPFTFVLSDQESSFRQPFNQLGVSPQYKWATLHLGYRSLSYSKYTLAGITFLGAGIDLDPDPLRFSFMYGRFQRAVEEDTTNVAVQPAYQRMGFAGKIGYGNDQAFFDLIYLHAKDDSASLSHPPVKIDLFPQENTILGMNTRIKIIEALTFDGEVAGSFLTRDIRSPLVDSTQIPKSLQWIIDTRSSTSLLFASTTGLTFRVPHFGMRVGYERIEPDFTSLGAYYFTTDIENYTIAPSFDAFQNKLRVSGSVGIQNDNVLGTKLAKTQRIIGSGNISINPTQVFGLDMNYANYSTQQGTNPKSTLINDSTRVSSVAQSASITPRFLFISSTTTQSVIVSGSYQDYTDQNIFTQQYANSKTTSGTINYNITFLKTSLSLGGSLLIADSKQAAITTSLKGLTVNASKALLDNKLSLGGSFGFTQSTITDINTTSTYSQSVNASYRISTQGTLAFTLYATENSNTLATVPPFTEILATLTYTHNFSF
ncbi:MAG TPA: hypothetical protein VEW28_09140 [Candidatus Kapabacteria bacterium]|nr:hypothetical protein [Candidatus Kapabacteria bacterium]